MATTTAPFMPPFISQEKIDGLIDIPLLDDDVFVVTFPKSGTFWTLEIVKLIRESGKETVHSFDATLLLEKEGKDAAIAFQSPRMLTTHLPYHKTPGGEPAKSVAKYIYVARNPKDVAVSFFHFLSSIKDVPVDIEWNGYFEVYLKGDSFYHGSWFDHVLEWWKHKDADNILFMKYEDMKKDLRGSVVKIAQFMGYSLDDAIIDKITEQCTFDSMKANPLADPSTHPFFKSITKENFLFLRKGTVGDWRNHFTDEQSSRFDDEYVKRMTGSGLEFFNLDLHTEVNNCYISC